MSNRLCIVEDDSTIRELVSAKLRQKGYQVDCFEDVDPLFKPEVQLKDWDLFIVDILIDGRRKGLELCRRLRQYSATIPVLILSALSEPSDRVEGLRQGADDYLVKPFEMEELILRVEGMLKRRSWYSELPNEQVEYHWGENSIDFVKFEGRRKNKVFALSVKECMLLKLLIQKKGQVVRRDEILDKVWGYDAFPSTRTVDNFILRLRKYFEETPNKPKHIHSVRGVGYKFIP